MQITSTVILLAVAIAVFAQDQPAKVYSKHVVPIPIPGHSRSEAAQQLDTQLQLAGLDSQLLPRDVSSTTCKPWSYPKTENGSVTCECGSIGMEYTIRCPNS